MESTLPPAAGRPDPARPIRSVAATPWRLRALSIRLISRQEGETDMLEVQRDLFARCGMSVVGWLLAVVCVLAAYELSDIAISRWFGLS